MKCIKCGKEMTETTRFCPECGTASVSQSAQPVSSSQFGTAMGTRDQIGKAKMVYPKNPPLSPHLCWVNLVLSGLAQMIYGQIAKGLVILIVTIASNLLIPFVLAIGVGAISIIDAYMVGNTLKSGKPVGKWRFFPKA